MLAPVKSYHSRGVLRIELAGLQAEKTRNKENPKMFNIKRLGKGTS